MRKVVQTVFLTTLTLLVFSVNGGEVDYEKIYKKQCATCHGNNGDGKGRAGASFARPPTDFTSAQSRLLPASMIKKAIRDGVAGSPMVAYGRRFDEKTLDGLVSFIQTRFMGKNKETVAADSAAKPSHPGQAIYIEHCAACHGDNGQSAVWAKNGLTPPPRNFTTAIAREELSLERMITSVTYGRPGTAMMSFQKRLNHDEILSVVDFIRQTFMQTAKTAVSASHGDNVHIPTQNNKQHFKLDMNAAFPGQLTGDVLLGKQFYESNCFTCHGKNGDGKGPRAHFNYPRPRNFTTQESRAIFNRPRLFKSISNGKPGSVMPAWKTVLTDQQIADVAEYVLQQFILKKKS